MILIKAKINGQDLQGNAIEDPKTGEIKVHLFLKNRGTISFLLEETDMGDFLFDYQNYFDCKVERTGFDDPDNFPEDFSML